MVSCIMIHIFNPYWIGSTVARADRYGELEIRLKQVESG